MRNYQFYMLYKHGLIIRYEKYDQQLYIQIGKLTVL